MHENSQDETPRIVLGADPFDEVYFLITQGSREGRSTARLVVRAIIEEGRRYLRTAEGGQAARQLANSRLLKNGKVLWTLARMDELLAEDGSAGPLERELAPKLPEILDALQSDSVEDYLMAFLEGYGKQKSNGHRNGSGSAFFGGR